jgi:hypothetical protein
MPLLAIAIELDFAPWAAKQDMELFLFVVRLPKEPRQEQSLMLPMAFFANDTLPM